MKAAEKEVEQLERKYREENGLPVEPENEGEDLPPIELPKFRVLQRQRRKKKREDAEKKRSELEDKVNVLEGEIRAVQQRLKLLTEVPRSTQREVKERTPEKKRKEIPVDAGPVENNRENNREDGADGPGGAFVPFPPYDGSERPMEWKKPFTQFCIKTRKEVKKSLDPADRKNKVRTNPACL